MRSGREWPSDDATKCNPLQEWGHDIGRKNVAEIGRLLGLERIPPG